MLKLALGVALALGIYLIICVIQFEQFVIIYFEQSIEYKFIFLVLLDPCTPFIQTESKRSCSLMFSYKVISRGHCIVLKVYSVFENDTICYSWNGDKVGKTKL